MKKIILISFLLFSYQVHADWTSFLSGALQQLNENAEKQGAKQKVKGSPEDYAILKEFAGCIQYVEKQSKYDHLNKKSPVPQLISYQHLSDNGRANNNEKDMIVAFVEEIEVCITRIDPNKINNNSLKSLLLQSQIIWSQTIMDFINVYNGMMTWGDLNKNIQQRANLSEQYFTQWEMASDEMLASKYKEIKQYWDGYSNQRKLSRDELFNHSCKRMQVYDQDGNFISVRDCKDKYNW